MERGPGGGDAGAEESEAERAECRTVRLTRGARERLQGTRTGTEVEAETEGRGEGHDLGGNCEWEGGARIAIG